MSRLQELFAEDPDWKPRPKEAASVYRWPDRLLVCAVVATRVASKAHEPYIRLPAGVSSFELGEAVIQAIDAAGGVVGDWGDAKADRGRKALLKAAGVRSWKEFHAACHSCGVVRKEGSIVVKPSENSYLVGRHKSFAYLRDAQVMCGAECGANVVGELVLLGLSRCTPAL